MVHPVRPETSFTLMFSVACEEAARASRMARAVQDLTESAAAGTVDVDLWLARASDEAPLCCAEVNETTDPCSLFAGHGGDHECAIRSPRVGLRDQTLTRAAPSEGSTEANELG